MATVIVSFFFLFLFFFFFFFFYFWKKATRQFIKRFYEYQPVLRFNF